MLFYAGVFNVANYGMNCCKRVILSRIRCGHSGEA